MAMKTINSMQLLEKLKRLDKPYYNIADLEKILEQKRKTLYVTLNRLVDSGVLLRLKRGVYKEAFDGIDYEKIANELYYPSYLSFESALSRYGVLSQIPFTLTFATNRRSKKIVLGNREVEYSQLKDKLFFGYKLLNGFYIAEPEKALLDQLYMVGRGERKIEVDELDLSNIKKDKLIDYSKSYPKQVSTLIKEVLKGVRKNIHNEAL
jgi:predicted transcriptional regulator of viral defense system